MTLDLKFMGEILDVFGAYQLTHPFHLFFEADSLQTVVLSCLPMQVILLLHPRWY